jgi:small subunit ribosomal protein S17
MQIKERIVTERNNRKTRVGIIEAISGNKTIKVKVEKRVPHPLYKKIYRVSKNYLVDISEDVKVEIGEKVMIMECRPISKRKKWRYVETINKKA